MICRRCRKQFAAGNANCPFCGEPQETGDSGVFQASTVLISISGSDAVYRSVDEVPSSLRSQLLKSTNGRNSATILIADRRGRQEIARVMRTLSRPAPGRPLRSLLGTGTPAKSTSWLTPPRKRAVLAIVFLLASCLVALAFFHR
jgi:hypothetical protein